MVGVAVEPVAAAAIASTIGSSGSLGFSFDASLIALVMPCSASACLAPLPGRYAGRSATTRRGRPMCSLTAGTVSVALVRHRHPALSDRRGRLVPSAAWPPGTTSPPIWSPSRMRSTPWSRRSSPDQWALPTPSPGWSVADQIAHLTYFDTTAALAITRPRRVRRPPRRAAVAVRRRGRGRARDARPVPGDDRRPICSPSGARGAPISPLRPPVPHPTPASSGTARRWGCARSSPPA